MILYRIYPEKGVKIAAIRSLISDPSFTESKAELPIAIGSTFEGKTKVFDLAKAPHLLVAGSTNQGKSVGLNVIAASLLYAKRPSELKMLYTYRSEKSWESDEYFYQFVIVDDLVEHNDCLYVEYYIDEDEVIFNILKYIGLIILWAIIYPITMSIVKTKIFSNVLMPS